MRDTRLRCDCCGQCESTSGCVRGVVNCPCEIETGSFHIALDCPECERCPVHCKCHSEKCICERREWSAQHLMMARSLGLRLDHFHEKECPVPVICRAQIRKAKAELELNMATVMLDAALASPLDRAMEIKQLKEQLKGL